jgi:hypothetical protein
MDVDEALAIWKIWLSRCKWERARADAEAGGDAAGAQAAEQALARLPAVSALEALRANADLVSVLSAQRWIAMRVAQELGASSEEIGKMLGISRQSAWEFMRRKFAEQQRQTRSHEAAATLTDGDVERAGTAE